MAEKRYTLAIKKESNILSLSEPTSDIIPTNEAYVLSYIDENSNLISINNKR